MGQKDWKRKLYFFELGVKCFAHKAQDFSRFGVIRPDFDQDSSDIFYLQLIQQCISPEGLFRRDQTSILGVGLTSPQPWRVREATKIKIGINSSLIVHLSLSR